MGVLRLCCSRRLCNRPPCWRADHVALDVYAVSTRVTLQRTTKSGEAKPNRRKLQAGAKLPLESTK